MPKTLTKAVQDDLERALQDVARTLHNAADDLSDDAERAVAEAARALREAAQKLADKAPPEARFIAEKASAEAKAHPIATAAAALSAAAALIALLGVGRRKPS